MGTDVMADISDGAKKVYLTLRQLESSNKSIAAPENFITSTSGWQPTTQEGDWQMGHSTEGGWNFLELEALWELWRRDHGGCDLLSLCLGFSHPKAKHQDSVPFFSSLFKQKVENVTGQ